MPDPLVILVEDNPDDELFATKAITSSGLAHRLCVIRSGEEALEYVKRQGKFKDRSYDELPTLIFLDIKLGPVDGFNVLHEIRGDSVLHTVPVLMLSGSDEPKDVRLAYEKGANGYIQKSMSQKQANERAKITLQFWLKINIAATSP